MLTLELWNKWPKIRLHLRRPELGLDGTNNVSERSIGRSKVRYKTMRGNKSMDGTKNGIGLTQWLYSGEDEHEIWPRRRRREPGRIPGLFVCPASYLQDMGFHGGPGGTRTRGLRRAKAALSRLSYGPETKGWVYVPRHRSSTRTRAVRSAPAARASPP